jgi:diguanylate cyclase (GGDEF)-like protein/PAS domain S-box-containing protein
VGRFPVGLPETVALMEREKLRQRQGRSWRSSQIRLVLFFALTWLGVAGLLAFLLEEGRQQAERKAEADAQGVSTLLEARLAGTIQRLQGTLEHIATTLPPEAFQPATVPSRGAMVRRELILYSRHFPEVASFRVLDAAGNLLYASSAQGDETNFREQDYWRVFAEGRGNDLYFSAVEVDRSSARSILNVAVPARLDNGGLKGVVVARLDLTYLGQWFDSVAVGVQGVVSFRRIEDGSLILRRPNLPERVNQPLLNHPLQQQVESGVRSGTLRMRATLDGVERIYGFRRLGDYPLYVIAGLAADDVLAGWRHSCMLAVVAGLLLFLTLSLALIRVLRAGSREAVTARRLQDSEARYRMLAENSHDVIWTIDIPSRRYTYVSSSVSDMLGYTVDEVLGQSCNAWLTPDSALRLAREVDLRLRRIAAGDPGAGVLVSELEMVRKDGEQVAVEVVSSYLLDEDGVARTILGITRNVSERKAAESALRESNRQLHARIEEIGRLQSALQELAVRDSLTGLYNRRYLDETLEREVSRARREGIPLSLVMLDIDYFKRVNDTYGHQVGDEVLRTLAATLSADIRTEDVACRYGGEEFLILLPNMPLVAALARAEAWRAAVESLAIGHGDFVLTFTISLGVAAYPEHGKTPDDLTRCADQALYKAKHEGRNRVSVYSD